MAAVREADETHAEALGDEVNRPAGLRDRDAHGLHAGEKRVFDQNAGTVANSATSENQRKLRHPCWRT